MKKIVFISAMALLLLSACSSSTSTDGKTSAEKAPKKETTEEVTKKDAESEKVTEPEELPSITSLKEAELRDLLKETAMGEGDELGDVSVDEGKVDVAIKLGPSDLLSDEDFAVTRYSQASDELLGYSDWDRLTITYTDIGSITMDRNEKETNEFGQDYFPTAVIMDRLK